MWTLDRYELCLLFPASKASFYQHDLYRRPLRSNIFRVILRALCHSGKASKKLGAISRRFPSHHSTICQASEAPLPSTPVTGPHFIHHASLRLWHKFPASRYEQAWKIYSSFFELHWWLCPPKHPQMQLEEVVHRTKSPSQDVSSPGYSQMFSMYTPYTTRGSKSWAREALSPNNTH